MSYKGIDIRSGTTIIFRAFLRDSNQAALATGTTTLMIVEVQSDGTFKTYDFNDNTFKSTACTTPTVNMTHRQANNNTVNTGVWNYVLSTLTGFTANGIYKTIISNSTASPVQQVREWQYGGNQEDISTLALASTFSGMTSLPKWLRGIFRKDAMDATAKTEVNDGGGNYDETTDSNEAIRDTAPLGTPMRGTDSAALASVCTEGRLAELDATNIPANVDTLNTKIGTALTYTGGKPDVNITSQDNIDFGTAQKTSLNAATPASIQSYGSLVSDIVTSVWSAGTRTITNTLLTAQNVWEYAIRKLTSSLTDEGSPKDMSAVNDLTSISSSLSTIDGIVDDIKTEVLTHPTLSEIEASTILAKEAILENATHGLAALKTLIDNIDTSTELAERFTDLKGIGYTIENLKAIYDRIGVAIQAISTLDGLVTIGSDAVTITVLDENNDPIPDVVITIKNSDQSSQITTPIFTDANGKTFDTDGNDRVMLDPVDSGYKILCRKIGYTFSVVTLTKAEVEAGAKTISGTSWLVGMPVVDPNAVMVYEDLFAQDGYTPMNEADVVATATIISLPYDYDDHLHEGNTVDATLHKVDNVFTGRVYWMLARGSKVQFDIENFNKVGKSFKKTIPIDAGITQIRLYDIP